ncbi:NAD-dependent glycerol-3-phosphate dehydrogenase family protein [Collimonas fungivorans]|uniref:NAD-dependent glycerol-3-phosphate dehydrogenase family protein n=1 Tax=Collimonas fungivorans TaxID=158899 RepID=A0A127P5G5_9BURK|nr:NAD(P)-dependent oxidoreductase [Collimonas fungivorans]AMO93076.1 NAD-dependent glycerol-3-phosphate dehydrogenase family protein [Collimonas fungivorans]
MANITFLGTGLLGAAFAEAAAKRGDSVTAWNRSIDKVHALAQFGVKAAATPAEAVQGAARVHIVVKDDAVVDEVIAAARTGLSPEAILIDHTTTLPTLTAKRAERLHAAGLKYLHCPVFMGPPAARNAQGIMMVTGPKALFESVQADLAKMTGRLEYLGERSDLAAVNKLFGNAMIIGLSAVIADILTLAQASGVDGEDAIKLLGLLDLNGMVTGRGLNMAKGNFTASFELAMARKDVRLMLETSGNRPMAALPAVAARMDQLIAAGHGAADASALGIDAVQRP